MTKKDILTVKQAAPHSLANLGISLCALFFPSFTPVLNLTVTGISPNALFIPTKMRPSLPGASRTTSIPQFSFYFRANQLSLTSTSTPSFKHQVNGTSTINVHKINIACAFLADDFCSRDESIGFVSSNLNTENAFRGMSTDEGPFFFRALEERGCETHWKQRMKRFLDVYKNE
jgi:hypothetical protein